MVRGGVPRQHVEEVSVLYGVLKRYGRGLILAAVPAQPSSGCPEVPCQAKKGVTDFSAEG